MPLFVTSTDEHLPEWMHTRENRELSVPERWGLLGAHFAAIVSLRTHDPESLLQRRVWRHSEVRAAAASAEVDPDLHRVTAPPRALAAGGRL